MQVFKVHMHGEERTIGIKAQAHGIVLYNIKGPDWHKDNCAMSAEGFTKRYGHVNWN